RLDVGERDGHLLRERADDPVLDVRRLVPRRQRREDAASERRGFVELLRVEQTSDRQVLARGVAGEPRPHEVRRDGPDHDRDALRAARADDRREVVVERAHALVRLLARELVRPRGLHVRIAGRELSLTQTLLFDETIGLALDEEIADETDRRRLRRGPLDRRRLERRETELLQLL